jgi:hypothetical protein
VNLHLSVQLEGAVKTPHAPVEQFVEVNVAIVALDSHLEHDLLHLVIRCFWRQANRHGQPPEENEELFFSQPNTAALRCRKVYPSLHKGFAVHLELFDRVIISDVIFFELHDNHKDKQVKHHVLHKKHKDNEEGWSVRRATVDARLAVRRRNVAVVHQHVPIFTGADHKKEQERFPEVVEVPILIDNIAFNNFAEEKHSQNAEDEENEQQQDENIGNWAHRILNCLHQGL